MTWHHLFYLIFYIKRKINIILDILTSYKSHKSVRANMARTALGLLPRSCGIHSRKSSEENLVLTSSKLFYHSGMERNVNVQHVNNFKNKTFVLWCICVILAGQLCWNSSSGELHGLGQRFNMYVYGGERGGAGEGECVCVRERERERE